MTLRCAAASVGVVAALLTAALVVLVGLRDARAPRGTPAEWPAGPDGGGGGGGGGAAEHASAAHFAGLEPAPGCVDFEGVWLEVGPDGEPGGEEVSCESVINEGRASERCGTDVDWGSQHGWGGWYCRSNGMGGDRCCARRCDTCPFAAATQPPSAAAA